MLNRHHQEIRKLIHQHAGKPTQHIYLDNYLGNTHPRYPINVPTLRSISKTWMLAHRDIDATQFSSMLTSLAKGKSSTEKCMVGILLDYSTLEQRKFDPTLFTLWLEHMEGWAEVDSICTGNYTVTEIINQWGIWKKQLIQLSKSKNINKRRASLVLLCSPLRNLKDEKLITLALQNIDRLKQEEDILITKAISWTLRTMEKHYREILTQYLSENMMSLPKIALRETLVKLKTGTKTKRKQFKP